MWLARDLEIRMQTLPAPFTMFGDMLARAQVGLFVTDARGHVEHANASLMRTLSTDPEHARIENTLRAVILRLMDQEESSLPERLMAVTSTPPIEVKTARANYRVCASRMGPHICGVLSVLSAPARAAPTIPTAALLVERFKLTPREADVGVLLARGRSNSQIAAALAISPFTARRHTERVLMKLNAHSRAEVSAVMLGLTGASRERAG